MVRSNRWLQAGLWLSLVILAGLLLLFRLWGAEADAQSGRGGDRPPPVVEFMTVVEERYIDETVTTGTLRAQEQIDLRVEVSGKLVTLGFEEGQQVSKGTLLLQVDESELEAELIRVARQRDLASLREERLAPLVDNGGVSETEYDVASSEVSILEAEMDLIRAQIARHFVYAPFDGTVGLRYVSKGAYVTPASRIATFQKTDQIRVEFSLPEKYSTLLQTGQQVRFRVASETEEFPARIYAIEPEIDEVTRTLLVRALADNTHSRLRPGAFARVVWQKEVFEEAILVPAVSVIRGEEGETVFVIKEGRVEKRSVNVGDRVGERIRILAGLEPGEKVITSGIQQVRPGGKVSVLGKTDLTQAGS